MKTVDETAWAEALGVGPKEVPWLLSATAREIEEILSAVDRLRRSLKEAPDDQLVMQLGSVSACLAAVGDRVNEALLDIRRGR